MTDEEEIALAKKVPAGGRRAMLAMTETPQLPGFKTFNANAAFNLSWMARSYGGLAKSVIQNGRAAYYLTPLGVRIRDRLASVDTDRMAETPLGGSGRSPSGAVPATPGDAQSSGPSKQEGRL